ncbi:hypothetical protein BDW68DRAFT_175328 [Aspergillus falconensis]
MPSSIFDQFQSPGSYDVDFDKVWRLNSERADDPVRFLHQLLQRVYWNAARDEFANAILAFDDYKAFVPETTAEDKLVALFLRIARIWRDEKSVVGYEAENRSLLQKCATQLTDRMQHLFSAATDPHLTPLAQKLGKTQKLAYSRMSNNCQDFCNDLLSYESYSYPMFNYMHPFIPVTLSPEIRKKADEECVSYLQSFARPLQYPIPGSSNRAMLGSAVTMYSSYAQNDADFIDHVYWAR